MPRSRELNNVQDQQWNLTKQQHNNKKQKKKRILMGLGLGICVMLIGWSIAAGRLSAPTLSGYGTIYF